MALKATEKGVSLSWANTRKAHLMLARKAYDRIEGSSRGFLALQSSIELQGNYTACIPQPTPTTAEHDAVDCSCPGPL